MSAEKEQSPITVFSYSVRSTHVVTGLPYPHEQHVLSQYRSLFHQTEERDHPVASAEYTPGTKYGDLNTTYDITCQYLRNLHTMESRGTHTDSDDDSMFSVDPEIPPLDPVAPSCPGSPVPQAEAVPAEEGAVPLRASSPSAPVTGADDEAVGDAASDAPDPELPPVPAWHPWSSQEAWRRGWDRLGEFNTVVGEKSERERVAALTAEWTAVPNLSVSGLTAGEGVERMWAGRSPVGTSTRPMAEGFRRTTLDGTGHIHNLRIISVVGVREVKCDCTDGRHTIYEHEHSFAFRGRDDYEVRRGETSHDIGFHVSTDGRRAVRQGINVGVKKRRVAPSDLVDTYGDWMPLHGDADDIRTGLDDNDGQEDPSASGEKRKRYESSDDPFNLWRPLLQRFLDELARREGLGDDHQQECGEFFQCKECLLARHALSPLHKPQEWKGNYWVTTTLNSLGLVYQLGHGGHPCPHPAPTKREMVVMDMDYIHTVEYQFCACDKSDRAPNLEQLLRNGWYPATTVDPATCATFASLELFRLLSVVGNINVHDFVGTLERLTNASQTGAVPDRYKAFGRMSRQYAFLKRMLRAARAHDPDGVWATENGECAVLCWTCPHDGKNLPEGWRNVSPEFQFLYMLLLAMDANFRLKNRIRANEHDDPPLGSGWGHLVEEAPYKEHLKGYVAEKDVSTCIAFAALMQKDTRLTTGLRCSGVGGVVCARHELVRPQGMGDLQKGERYSNMDYIMLSAVLGITALYLAISYDIACQWKINLPGRIAQMPEHMRLNLAAITLLFGLPVWHAAAHEKSCQVQNSLTYVDGVGRTDGEGIERTWSHLNPLAWATKEMRMGARHDALEDKIDHLNFEKNIGQETTLPRKLILAIDERDRQVAAFTEVDRTLKKEIRKKWQKEIDAWKADNTKPNPYEMADGTGGGPSEAEIRLSLTKDEAQEAATGGGKLHGSSVTAFLTAGLQLEETQRRIRLEVKGRTVLAAEQSQRLTEMRRAFFRKLGRFRKLQEVYMTKAVEELEAEEDARDSELPPPQAEDIKLYLPSGLRTAADREAGCKKGLPEMEAKLREGQCSDALRQLRTRLHAKRHLLDHREDGNVAGQRAATRSYTLIGRIGERVDAAAAKYRRSRLALIALRGREAATTFRELKAADVQLDEEREIDARARRRLGEIGSSRHRRKGPALSSKEKHFSWIWTEGGGPGEDEVQLHSSVRVEWSKAKARKERWEEEVALLREEMKRVLRFLRWRAQWWETRRASRRAGVSPELRGGLEAYAARQAAGAREIARRFKTSWDTSAATAVRMAVRDDAALAEGMAAFAEASEGLAGPSGDSLGAVGNGGGDAAAAVNEVTGDETVVEDV
ncbi:hypothetical protein C8R47DRAFT_1228133 [Mycena vitilis]|nr:hypothetical protein C8R47DRAFT_1228133 [Mycena vitilis]